MLRPKNKNILKCKILEIDESGDPVIRLRVQTQHGVFDEKLIAASDIATIEFYADFVNKRQRLFRASED